VDLSFSAEDRAVAEEFAAWLSANLPPVPAFAGMDDEVAWGRAWQDRLAGDRWVGIDWPERYGGRGASPLQVALANLAYGRSGAPQLVNRVGLNLAGPTLLAHGSQAQRERLLPHILDASEIWCQLFSEPGAGSDLASLRTAAERVPGGWALSGQKVWTSYAQYARWGICLARTDAAAERHRGITYFVVDVTAPGVTIRPLRQITGESEFNEVFLDSVFVPDERVVGPVGEGWRVASTTLAHERGTNFPIKEQTVHEGHFARLWSASDLADVAEADEVAHAYVRLRLLGLSNLRTLSRLAAGGAPGAESSVVKLQWSDMSQELSALWARVAPDEAAAQRQLLWSKAASIAGGTSEVQRTIIGERLLGLPRG
jgi:alkylation response protein AidB-like acyl-CoA dehydrogenase